MNEYTIRGGDKGKHRLEILSRTIGAQTKKFLASINIPEGIHCLDIGCGGGDVSFLLSEIIGEKGTVISYDIDARNIELASHSAQDLGITNVHFSVKDAHQLNDLSTYDLIYSRFLLSHLKEPGTILDKLWSALRTGGILLIEETDFSGHFSYPKSKEFDQYVSLYQQLLSKRGADSNLGQKLFGLLTKAGFENIDLQVSQPIHVKGEGKLMAEITLEGISEALIDEGVISKKGVEDILSGLIEFRKKPNSILSLPRIFQLKAEKK